MKNNDAEPTRGRKPAVIHVTRDEYVERNHELEALWFELTEPTFVTTAFVPVAPVSSADALEMALSLARIGASVLEHGIEVVDARGLAPSDAWIGRTTLRQATSGDREAFVVTDGPSSDPGGVPVLQLCHRIVLVVGLQQSRTRDVEAVLRFLPEERIVGAVCFEPRPKRTSPQPS